MPLPGLVLQVQVQVQVQVQPPEGRKVLVRWAQVQPMGTSRLALREPEPALQVVGRPPD